MKKLDVGYNIPASKGMKLSDVQTPSLIVNYELFKQNVLKMKKFSIKNKVLLRPHAKMHKSIEIAKFQIKYGGASGISCQKVSEAEVFARGGIKDILVTNEVCDDKKIERLAKINLMGTTIGCCVDDLQNVKNLQRIAKKFNSYINIYVEIECGAKRCGIKKPEMINDMIRIIKKCKNLNFSGIQAYNGSNQHIINEKKRRKAVTFTNISIKKILNQLDHKNLFVTGGGTGCFEFEVADNIYNEIQVGSYAFMDSHYSKIQKNKDKNLHFKNSLFLFTSVMSNARKGYAIVDAGLKSQSVDSGLPEILGKSNLKYIKCSDEHGVIRDKYNNLKINDKLLLIPGHCDPTCNLHDWYVLVRNKRVIDLWPINARGFSF